jgi:hypothetical protein
VLGWSELRRRPSGPAGGAAPDLLLLLRLSKAQLKSAPLQEEVVSQARLGFAHIGDFEFFSLLLSHYTLGGPKSKGGCSHRHA